MSTKRTLRVATEADAKPAPPRSMIEVVEGGGSYLEFLQAQRLEMMSDVKDLTGPARAALHRLIATHSKEIAALQAREAAQEASDDAAEVEDGDFDEDAV